MTKKGYITRGKSGWTIAFFDGQENVVRFLHGFYTWQQALDTLKELWSDPPDYQNGFCTIVEL